VSTKEKLIQRFKKLPKDFTWEELVRVFEVLGFAMSNKGKTSGSRVLFRNGNDTFYAHKPHPSNVVKEIMLKQALNFLKINGYIN